MAATSGSKVLPQVFHGAKFIGVRALSFCSLCTYLPCMRAHTLNIQHFSDIELANEEERLREFLGLPPLE
jgi:hypothetical protein